MSEPAEKDSKTEDPSEKKLNDTLEKGNTPSSRELTNSLTLLAIVLVAYFYVPIMVGDFASMLATLLGNIQSWSLENPNDAAVVLNYIGSNIFFGLAPLILPLMAFGLLSAVSQNMPRMVGNRLAPKLERISIFKGLVRMFGKQGFREFCKSLFKFTSAAVISLLVFWTQRDFILAQLGVDVIQLPANIHGLFVQVALGLVVTSSVLGALDVVWVRKDWFDDLKMTQQEVKDERKQSEGDPMVKMRSRSLARDRSRKNMINRVSEATVVIANPTHFSVALRYDPLQDSVPFVLGKGQDRVALKMRSMAEENDVPIIEDKPLARSLYKVVQVDQEIPPEFYIPIAQIIRTLMDAETKVSS